MEFDAGENPIGIPLRISMMTTKQIILWSVPKQNGISTPEDGTLTLFKKNSSSSSRFPLYIQYHHSCYRRMEAGCYFTDFNGDNKTDLVSTHTGEDKIKLLRNDGSANFTDNGSVTVGDVPIISFLEIGTVTIKPIWLL
ncbi:MAG: hypothetical protein Ct9H300mP21_02270 [Pseudomonadota bacterium]|nr:MAG: hypothetical protein Ct9H300mP21_02270 [Pseudomonadota bacterium]